MPVAEIESKSAEKNSVFPTGQNAAVSADTNSAVRAEIKRLVFIDGLRFLAILCVVLNHAWHWYTVGRTDAAKILGGAIEFIFVLSGFCLFLPLVRDKGAEVRKLDLTRYAKRRLARIYPPYIAGLALSLVLLYVCSLVDYKSNICDFSDIVPWHGKTWLNLLSHLTLAHSLFPDFIRSINGTYWVLSLECQMYVLFPVVMFVTNKYSLKAALILMFAATLAYRLVAHFCFHSTLATWSVENMNGLARWSSFACGMLAAAIISGKIRLPEFLNSQRRLLLCALTLLVMAIACQLKGSFAFIRPMIWSSSAALWLIYLGTFDSPLRKVLSLPMVVAIGRISYSWYISHWSVLVVVGLLAAHFAIGHWAMMFVAPLLTVPFAYLFFRIFELPFSGDKARLAMLKRLELEEKHSVCAL